jgi:HPt (histidine-containing phosphotransfer) domain-containing protein
MQASSTSGAGLARDIPGLDIAAGLRRMEGDVELYMALLRDFAITEKGAAADIAERLAAGDLAEARRRAHTVKGLAGTFGAQELYPAAMGLEMALQQALPPDEIAVQLHAFADALARIIAGLEAHLPSEAQADEPIAEGPVDRLRLAAACNELALLLADCDMGAGRVLGAHAALLRAAFGDACLQLEQSLRGFDFEAAAAVLADACRQHGIPLSAR